MERKKKAEGELKKKKKAEMKLAESRKKAELKERGQAENENCPHKKKKPPGGGSDGLQQEEITYNECAACLGLFADDLNDGELCE